MCYALNVKGVVFNLLEEVVTEQHGDAAWDRILVAANVSGAYTSLGNYPDAELEAIVGAGERLLGTPRLELLRWFGRSAMPKLSAMYPQLFDGHASTPDFIATLNDVIHPEVRKLYPGADVPWFDYERSEGHVRLGYRSTRRMCGFAEGLVLGAADHFGETVTITQPSCMLRGDARCLLDCTFGAAR